MTKQATNVSGLDGKNLLYEELEEIRKSAGGILVPADVVAYAKKNKKSLLHERFTWDNTEAAEKWRLEEARNIIRMNVIVINESSEPIRAYVSLSSDRTNGGGYRAIVDVLDDPDMHARLLADALAELRAIKKKYARVTKLQPLWDALKRLETG